MVVVGNSLGNSDNINIWGHWNILGSVREQSQALQSCSSESLSDACCESGTCPATNHGVFDTCLPWLTSSEHWAAAISHILLN